MADCPTTADFRVRFPEFTEAIATEAQVQLFLDDACDHLDQAALGDCWERAVLYYAAHLLTISIRTGAAVGIGGVANVGAAGAVTSSGADGLNISFGSSSPGSGTEAWYQSTPYGQQFLVIVDECSILAIVTGSSCVGSCD